jgi:hypothetical protein
MQDGTQTKRGRSEQTTENITMKFILSFLIATAILSADTCVKLSLGDAALSSKVLCAPVNIFTPPTPIKCVPVLSIPTIPTILCNLPTMPASGHREMSGSHHLSASGDACHPVPPGFAQVPYDAHHPAYQSELRHA